MRAAIFRNGQIVVDTIADPAPAEGQVLVKTLCCGICGTDLHAAKYTRQFVERSSRAGGRWPMDPTRDVVFGHEFCCEVVDHGPGTDKRLKSGTLVCSMPMTIVDRTVQGIGYSNEVAGGFAQFMPLAERLLLEVPNGLPAARAALTEPIAVGWHAVQNARLTREDVPLVIGCGPVGLAVIAGLTISDVASDHCSGFFARAACARAADGRGHRGRSSRNLALHRVGTTPQRPWATMQAAMHSCLV